MPKTIRRKYAKGRALKEERENSKEAVALVIEANRELMRLRSGESIVLFSSAAHP